MSDQNPNLPEELAAPVARRAGSLTLRETGGVEAAAVDPANQSLADALRVMLRLLQFGMVILAVLYVFSGMKRVNEGERGIKLLFGKKVETNLEPGFHWTPPYPIGELVKVPQGYQELDIGRDFWVDVPDGQVDKSLDKLVGTPSLKPDQNGSGSVITADGNIAHTKWKASFKRTDVSKFSERVYPEAEQDIVKAAVKQAVVQAVSEVTLNQLLQQASTEGATVPARAKALAQQTLDELETGLFIDGLTMDPPIPPLYLKDVFNAAAAASAQANKTIQEAQSYRSERLNNVAGGAAKYLIYYIDQYEQALAKKDPKADEILTTIEALMVGQSEVEVLALGDDGKPERDEEGVATGRKISVRIASTGEIATRISDATLYRTGVRSRAQTTLSRYQAKLAQFQQNPTVMMQNEWDSAMRSFMSKPNFELMTLPKGVSTISLLLNSDPDIERDIQADQKRRLREKQERDRQQEQMRRGKETDTNALNVKG
ncbi:MAG TPA: SPFH domain-containing protein [Phycisphaerales bacterium]|nr:SPFH domain-containing protein [Phycisphaerales bacterium]